MTHSPVTVSVGMPVYNGATWLRDAAGSILDQTFTDFELIISDNASTDDSPAIAEELARHDDRVIVLRREVNNGATANFNAVLEKATGRYFKWASCNDYCSPEFLERCLDVLEADSSVVLAYPQTSLFAHDIGDARAYEDDLNLPWDSAYDRFTTFLRRVGLNNVMNGLIRREPLMKTALMRPYFSSDTWLMAELTLHGKFIEIPERLFFRRMSEESATKLKSEDEMVRHWRPDRKPVQFSTARGLLQLFGSLYRAPIDAGTRARLAGMLLRRTLWSRVDIWRELVDSSKYYTGLIRHNDGT